MKKILLWLFLGCGACYAADAVVVAAPAQALDFMALAKDVLIVLATVFGAIITTALPAIVKAILRHFGMAADSAELNMITSMVDSAANWATHLASTQAIQPTHNAKVDAGFAHVNEILDDKLIQAYGIVPLRNMISAKISALDTPATPAAAVAAPVAAAALKAS